nr:M56 family metallopeptidase [Aliikangiella sp. G2MR2-5]
MLILFIRPFIVKYLSVRTSYQLWLLIPLFLLFPNFDFVAASSNGNSMFFASQVSLIPSIEKLGNQIDGKFIYLALGIWLGGFAFSLGRYFIGYYQLNKSLTDYSYQPQSPLLQKIISNAPAGFRLTQSRLVNCPGIFGITEAKIILPRRFEEMNVLQQEIILCHELFHFQRRDHLINQFRNIFKCIFWFNPVIYVADKYFEADQELSCDQGVLEAQSEIDPKDYAMTLLDEAVAFNYQLPFSQWNYSKLVKNRIMMIGKSKYRAWHKWLLLPFALISLGFTSLIVAQNNGAIQSEGPVPVKVIQPDYPREAVNNDIEGEVKFSFDLDNDGTPRNLKIVHSIPHGIFDKDATKAIKQWRFDTKSNAKTNLKYTLQFRLPDDWKEIKKDILKR